LTPAKCAKILDFLDFPGRWPEASLTGRAFQSKSLFFNNLLIILWVLACLAGGDAQATISRWLSLEELAAHCDLVVRGRIESVRVEWSGDPTDGPRFPVTIAVLAVSETMFGREPAGRAVEVRQPGGSIDGIIFDYGGRPRFAVGEEAVMFLRPGPGSSFLIVGMAQGMLQVVEAADSRGPELVRDLGGMVFVDSPPAGSIPTLPTPGARTRLEDLRRALSRLPEKGHPAR
jgi:hypothetical protein